jgi:hypothetical protein
MELALDPVGVIPEMLGLTEKGHGVVIGVPESRFDEYPLRRLFSRVFHGLNRVFTGTEMYPGSSWFRALSRSALNALVVSQFDTLPFRHATVSIGFNPVVLKYRRAPVSGRAPRPSFFKDVRQGMEAAIIDWEGMMWGLCRERGTWTARSACELQGACLLLRGWGSSSNADHGQWHDPEGKAHLRSEQVINLTDEEIYPLYIWYAVANYDIQTTEDALVPILSEEPAMSVTEPTPAPSPIAE